MCKAVKSVKSDSAGVPKYTVKASVDGYWRYHFVGTSTTGKASPRATSWT